MAGVGFMTGGIGQKIAALAITMILAVVLSVQESALTGPVYSILLLVCYLLVSGLIDGFMEQLVTSGRTIVRSREVPSPTLRPRVRLALRVGLAWGLITGFVTTYVARIAPGESLSPGRYGALIGTAAFLLTFVSIGGGPLLEQRVLRYNLGRLRPVPWPCLPFLDFMTECLILRKVGHGYIFVHRELLDFLADLEPTLRSGLAPPAASRGLGKKTRRDFATVRTHPNRAAPIGSPCLSGVAARAGDLTPSAGPVLIVDSGGVIANAYCSRHMTIRVGVQHTLVPRSVLSRLADAFRPSEVEPPTKSGATSTRSR